VGGETAARGGEKIRLEIRVWVYLYAWFVGSHGLAGVGPPGAFDWVLVSSLPKSNEQPQISRV
jgi:hypothetical protein